MTNRKTGYPLATIIYNGPDDQIATKVVVTIVSSENSSENDPCKKWFSKGKDIREDATVLHDMLTYIQAHHARRVVLAPRILGCPHEEGIDYPEGETCPECPFWANRDRWTGEIILADNEQDS
jgi:hypothetical protein